MNPNVTTPETQAKNPTPPPHDEHTSLVLNVESIAGDIGASLDIAELAMAEQLSGDQGDDPLDVVMRQLAEIRRHQAALRYYAARKPEGGTARRAERASEAPTPAAPAPSRGAISDQIEDLADDLSVLSDALESAIADKGAASAMAGRMCARARAIAKLVIS